MRGGSLAALPPPPPSLVLLTSALSSPALLAAERFDLRAVGFVAGVLAAEDEDEAPKTFGIRDNSQQATVDDDDDWD